MHIRRFSALLLGMWLAGTLFMAVVAIENYQAVDRTLEARTPAANQYVKVLGAESTRTLLRHQAGEMNRFLFHNWELAQFGIVIALGLVLLFATNGDRLYLGGIGLLLLILIAEHWLVTPQVTALGRAIDFIPLEAPSVERIKFWRFQNAYTVLEIGKLLLLAALSIRLLMIRTHRRRSSRKELDFINDTNHG